MSIIPTNGSRKKLLWLITIASGVVLTAEGVSILWFNADVGREELGAIAVAGGLFSWAVGELTGDSPLPSVLDLIARVFSGMRLPPPKDQ